MTIAQRIIQSRFANSGSEENKRRFVRTELIRNNANTGLSANLNRGLYAAKGDWLKPIAGDDMLMTKSIHKCIEFINSKNEDCIQLIHGIAKMYNENFKESNLIGSLASPIGNSTIKT